MAIGSGWPSALHKVAALGFQRAGISPHDEGFTRGTTSIQAADAEGWVVSVTPSMALQDGIPLMAFSVQGGDTQDQNLLQFSLNMVEFGMNVQEAAEAPNFTSYQMQNSFGAHGSQPGHVDVKRNLAPYSQSELECMGYAVKPVDRTYSPITAIWFDAEHGTMQGGASD